MQCACNTNPKAKALIALLLLLLSIAVGLRYVYEWNVLSQNYQKSLVQRDALRGTNEVLQRQITELSSNQKNPNYNENEEKSSGVVLETIDFNGKTYEVYQVPSDLGGRSSYFYYVREFIQDEAFGDYYDSIASGGTWFDYWPEDLVAVKGKKLFTFDTDEEVIKVYEPVERTQKAYNNGEEFMSTYEEILLKRVVSIPWLYNLPIGSINCDSGQYCKVNLMSIKYSCELKFDPISTKFVSPAICGDDDITAEKDVVPF